MEWLLNEYDLFKRFRSFIVLKRDFVCLSQINHHFRVLFLPVVSNFHQWDKIDALLTLNYNFYTKPMTKHPLIRRFCVQTGCFFEANLDDGVLEIQTAYGNVIRVQFENLSNNLNILKTSQTIKNVHESIHPQSRTLFVHIEYATRKYENQSFVISIDYTNFLSIKQENMPLIEHIRLRDKKKHRFAYYGDYGNLVPKDQKFYHLGLNSKNCYTGFVPHKLFILQNGEVLSSHSYRTGRLQMKTSLLVQNGILSWRLKTRFLCLLPLTEQIVDPIHKWTFDSNIYKVFLCQSHSHLCFVDLITSVYLLNLIDFSVTRIRVPSHSFAPWIERGSIRYLSHNCKNRDFKVF